MTDFPITLGDFEFSRFEVPDRIPFGGEQALTIHKLVGGRRVVDAMGRDDQPLEWSGRFTGPNALTRARTLDSMRIDGQPLTLTWSELSYTVLIKRFSADFEKPFLLPYQIACEVVDDLSTPVNLASGPDIDDMVGADLDDAESYGGDIGDDTFAGLVSILAAAVGVVGGLGGATQSAVASVLTPLAQTQAQLSGLISIAEGGFEDNDPVGGFLDGLPPESLASALMAQTAAVNALPDLYGASASLGRVATNLVDVTSGGARITTAGGDLYTLAAQAYGDESQWPVIARANGLTDPLLTGVNNLTIPPPAPTIDGVLQP